MSSPATDNPVVPPYISYLEGYLDALILTMNLMEGVNSLADLHTRLSSVRKRLEDERRTGV